MKRKTFIQLSTTLMAAPLISPYYSFSEGLLTEPQQDRLKNWAGNLTYSTGNVFYPTTVAEVQHMVKAHTKIKAIASTILPTAKTTCSPPVK
jgi:alditol oxidase